MKLRCFSLSLILILGCFLSHAQGLKEDILQTQKQELADLHEEEFGDIRDLISGREHQAIYHFTLGHPFWQQKAWFLGDLKTDLHYYEGLTMRYDVYRDLLLYLPDSISIDYMAVNQDQVEYFSLDNTHFFHLGIGDEKEAMDELEMEKGYYQLIYKGSLLMYLKNRKELKGKSGDAQNHSEFYDRLSRYLYLDGKFYLIKKRKHLLKALPKHKNEMKAYLRKNQVNIKKLSDAGFARLFSYYDSL